MVRISVTDIVIRLIELLHRELFITGYIGQAGFLAYILDKMIVFNID